MLFKKGSSSYLDFCVNNELKPFSLTDRSDDSVKLKKPRRQFPLWLNFDYLRTANPAVAYDIRRSVAFSVELKKDPYRLCSVRRYIRVIFQVVNQIPFEY